MVPLRRMHSLVNAVSFTFIWDVDYTVTAGIVAVTAAVRNGCCNELAATPSTDRSHGNDLAAIVALPLGIKTMGSNPF